MKIRKTIFITIFIISSLMLMACEDQKTELLAEDHSLRETNIEEKENIIIEDDPPETKETKEIKEVNLLEGYSSEEIEFARVWLQVIGNKETENINVHFINAGDPVNPYDEDSSTFKEDVTFITGDFVSSGNVYYSGNGDGTINIYDMPSHWQEGISENKTMEEYTRDIIENTELIYIEPKEDNELIETIEKITIHR